MHSNQSLCEEDRFVIDMRLFKVKSALMVNHAAVRISLGTVTFLCLRLAHFSLVALNNTP
jgi:hypothetical protein